MTGNVIRGAFRPRLRIIPTRDPLLVLRGAAVDLRETAMEAAPDRDGLLEIAARIERALAQIEGAHQ